MPRHVAVIPARKGSKGLPGKNRLLFDFTADFLDGQGWFSPVIVSTDDEVVREKAERRGYRVHHRTPELAGDAVSIKSVFRAVIRDEKIAPDAVLWLFYLPTVYKDPEHFRRARGLIEGGVMPGVCGLVPARTHPYNCWAYDDALGRMRQYVPNGVFRRQDLPPAWMLHHYICCFRAGALEEMTDELVHPGTRPFFLEEKTASRLIEVDTPEELARWRAQCAARERT